MKPRSPANALTSTVTSPADTEIPMAISGHRHPRDPVRDAHPRDCERGSPWWIPASFRKSPQARTPPIAEDSVRPTLPALTGAWVAASTKAVTTASTSALPL